MSTPMREQVSLLDAPSHYSAAGAKAWADGYNAAIRARGWQPIETAPKDGTEILGFREDCGVLIIRWTCCSEFCTDDELEDLDEEDAEKEDWFCADFIRGSRLEGSEVPTHWMPRPAPPVCEHNWVSCVNEVIESGEFCTKCSSIRAEPLFPQSS